VTILVLENIFIAVHFSLSQAENSRNPPERSWDLYLCPTNSNSRLGITLPGHEKGGIEDDIRDPDERGRHFETLTKEERTLRSLRGQNMEATRREAELKRSISRSEKLGTVSSRLGGRNMEATKEDQRGRNTEATREDWRGRNMEATREDQRGRNTEATREAESRGRNLVK